MKILQIIYSLSSGGAERFVVDLSNELAEQGHDVYLCVLRDDSINNQGFYKTEISTKVAYLNLKLLIGLRLSNIFAIFKVIKQVNPDVVHCHQNLVNYIFPLSIIFFKIKFLHTIHNDAPKEVNSWIEYWLRRVFYSSQKIKAITISNETSKSFGKYYKTKKYTEIYNGRKIPIPTDEFEQVKEYVKKLRKENNTIFLHVGRCAPQKNQKMLINVFNKLRQEGEQISLLIIGDGFDSALGKELKSIASDKIIFLGQKHNLANYFMNADAFCLSSIHEGMPISLIEALACGCTPICTPVGGIADTIENNVTGYLSKTISEEDYYEVIKSYLKNGDKINRADLFQLYSKKYSIEKCANEHLNCYLK